MTIAAASSCADAVVFLWFAGVSLLVAWQVFRSPALDHRLVMVGAVLPVAEGLTGGPRLLHTLAGAVVTLALVMLCTRRRRVLRRRLLGIPIGLLLHLVLDGVWTDTRVFWWPSFGLSFGNGQVPEVGRGILTLVMELVGGVALCFAWRRFGLVDVQRRAAFLRTGRIDRDLVP